MEPTPGRSSRDLPDGFSGLEKKLRKLRIKFIQQFDIKEPRMRVIVEELRRICGQVKRTQEKTDDVRAGVVALIPGGLGILASLFTGRVSLAAVAGVVAVAGGAVVGAANVLKTSSETDSVMAVETLGKEFKRIVEPLKRTLEEIKETCETLEEEAAEYQSGNTLTNMEELEENLNPLFKDFLKEVAELKVQIEKAYLVAESSSQMIDKLVNLIVKFLSLTSTSEQDKQLRDSIIQLADQGQKVIDECEKMKILLKEVLRRGQNCGSRVQEIL